MYIKWLNKESFLLHMQHDNPWLINNLKWFLYYKLTWELTSFHIYFVHNNWKFFESRFPKFSKRLVFGKVLLSIIFLMKMYSCNFFESQKSFLQLRDVFLLGTKSSFDSGKQTSTKSCLPTRSDLTSLYYLLNSPNFSYSCFLSLFTRRSLSLLSHLALFL